MDPSPLSDRPRLDRSACLTAALSDPARRAALGRTGLLDTPPEEAFDRVTRLAQRLLGVPVALISLVDADRQFFKSQVGLSEPAASERGTPLSLSFCQHVVATGLPLVVEAVRAHPVVSGDPAFEALGIEAYIGVPIRSPDGHVLGSLCGVDVAVHAWTADDEEALGDLVALVEAEIALRTELVDRRRSEDQYRALFEGASDALLLFDPETETVLDANDQAAALYGYPREALVGLSLKTFSAAPGPGETAIERLLGGGDQFVSVQRRRDGTEVHVTISASVVRVGDRDAVLTINRDVTAQRVAEAALRESRALVDRLALVAERTTNGVLVTDAHGRTEWVNAGLTRITGYTLDEFRGEKPGALLQGPETDPETVAQIRVHVGRREPFSAELVNHHRDGTPYWIRIEATPLFHDDGAFRGFMAIETDVTDRKRAEAALRESEARYRTVVETARDVIVQTDLDGRWTFLNAAWERLTGLPVGPSLGRLAFEFVHPDDRRRMAAEFRALVRGEAPFVRAEVRSFTGGESVRHVEVHAELLRGPAGHPTGVAGTVSDITDTVRFEAEREARRRTEDMLRLKSSFLNNMSHELRTPLTGILGYAELLAEEVGPEHREPVDVILRSAHRLQDTLNSVLDLAQLESGTVSLRTDPLDVLAEARDALALLHPVARAQGLRLDVVGGAALALADRPALHRVLYNLVGNALKFTPAGHVLVSVDAVDGWARLRVADTGIGIEPAFLPRLFDEFTQASEGYARTHEGNGLGLSITHRLVGLMGGTLAVESAVGVGTTFTVRLPAAEEPAAWVSRPERVSGGVGPA
jgi:PAS domain S-box-containing protein